MSKPPIPHPALSQIVIEIWSPENKLLKTLIVSHNETEGRQRTAFLARQAMIDGNKFITYRKKS